MNNRRIKVKTEQQKQNNRIQEKERYHRNKSNGIKKVKKHEQSQQKYSYYCDDNKTWRSVECDKYVIKGGSNSQSYATRKDHTRIPVICYNNFRTKLKNANVQKVNGKYDVVIEPDNNFFTLDELDTLVKNNSSNSNKRKNTEASEVRKKPKLMHSDNHVGNYIQQNIQEQHIQNMINTQTTLYPYYHNYNPQLFSAVNPLQPQVVQPQPMLSAHLLDISNVQENIKPEIVNHKATPPIKNDNQFNERFFNDCHPEITIDTSELDGLFRELENSTRKF
jgi:hypothetical protein